MASALVWRQDARWLTFFRSLTWKKIYFLEIVENKGRFIFYPAALHIPRAELIV